ncbi:MAG: acetyltransferase [Planctomycetota bacterium]
MTAAQTQHPPAQNADRPSAPADAQTGTPVGTSAAPPPTRRSVWTTKEKLIRLLWSLIAVPIWVLSPAARPALIRAFGGTAGPGCRFARKVQITIPWNIRCGSRVTVHDGAILYALGPITIGDDTLIDRRVHLCAGTHDMTDSTFPLIKPPITIGARCLLSIDSYVGPEVVMGDDCRTAPRTSVFKSVPSGTRLAGNPGKPIEAES